MPSLIRVKKDQNSRTIHLFIFLYMDWFQDILAMLSIALKPFKSFESFSPQISIKSMLKIVKYFILLKKNENIFPVILYKKQLKLKQVFLSE